MQKTVKEELQKVKGMTEKEFDCYVTKLCNEKERKKKTLANIMAKKEVLPCSNKFTPLFQACSLRITASLAQTLSSKTHPLSSLAPTLSPLHFLCFE
jgi:hypothetical protein